MADYSSKYFKSLNIFVESESPFKVIFRQTNPFCLLPSWISENNYQFEGKIIPYFNDGNYDSLSGSVVDKKFTSDEHSMGSFWIGKCTIKGYKYPIEIEGQFFRSEYSASPEYWITAEKRKHVEDFIEDLKLFEYSMFMKKSKDYILIYPNQEQLRPNLSWNDIILPSEIFLDIKTNIDSFFASKDLFKKFKIPYKRGILIVGKPGNGKSTLMKVIASQYREYAFVVFEGGENKDMDDVIDSLKIAQRMAPAFVLIEDLDKTYTESKASLSSLLNAMDGISATEGIFVIATSNEPGNIDDALLERPSRFDRVYTISLPEHKTALELLKRKAIGFSENFLESIAEKCVAENFSMAMIQETVIDAFLKASVEKREPTQEHLEQSFQQMLKQKHDIKQIKEKGDAGAAVDPIGFLRQS